jgi:hypothetical protein
VNRGDAGPFGRMGASGYPRLQLTGEHWPRTVRETLSNASLRVMVSYWARSRRSEMQNVSCNRHPLAFQWPSGWDDPCCGSYHPVSLHVMTLLTIILAIIFVVLL